MVDLGSTHDELQALIGRALLDPTFCKGLLNGHRAECLSEFDLSSEERDAARAIQAKDLTSFAGQLDEWIRDRASRPRGHGFAALKPTQRNVAIAA
jgi:hypothetical protein